MTNVKILDALNRLELQLADGYVNMTSPQNLAEMEIIAAALEEYRRNHNL